MHQEESTDSSVMVFEAGPSVLASWQWFPGTWACKCVQNDILLNSEEKERIFSSFNENSFFLLYTKTLS